MPDLKHATKKRLSKVVTSNNRLNQGISAEYTDYRTKLEKISTAVKSLLKQIQSTTATWDEIAKHQHSFANALFAALPTTGVMHSHAKEAEVTVRQLRRSILDDEGVDAPHRRIMRVLEAYLKLIENVQGDYYSAEVAWTEVSRYQKKVDKLSKRRKKEVLQRNIAKLSAARAEYDSKLETVLGRMKEVYGKHETVFQCAHHAFWIAQEKYSRVINDTTRSIRWESMAVRQHLLNIDINQKGELPPIPRVQMLPPPKAEVTEYQTVPLGQLEEAREHESVVVMPHSPLPTEDQIMAEPYLIASGPANVTEEKKETEKEDVEKVDVNKDPEKTGAQVRTTDRRVVHLPDPATEEPKSPNVGPRPKVTEPADVTAPTPTLA